MFSTGYKVTGTDNAYFLIEGNINFQLEGREIFVFLTELPRPPEFYLWMPQGTQLQVKNPCSGGVVINSVGVLDRPPRNLVFCSGDRRCADHSQGWNSVPVGKS